MKREERNQSCDEGWKKEEFPGISMEFQDWHCGTMACNVCANEFDTLRSSVGEVFLLLRATESKHTPLDFFVKAKIFSLVVAFRASWSSQSPTVMKGISGLEPGVPFTVNTHTQRRNTWTGTDVCSDTKQHLHNIAVPFHVRWSVQSP